MSRPRSVSIAPTRSSSVSSRARLVAVAAGRRAHDGLTRACASAPTSSTPRTPPSPCAARAWVRAGRCASRGRPIAASSKAKRDQGDRRVVDAAEGGGDARATASASKRGRCVSRTCQDHRVGVDSTSIRRRCARRDLHGSAFVDLDGLDGGVRARRSRAARRRPVTPASASIRPPIPPRSVKKTGAVGSGGCARRSARSPSSNDRDRSATPATCGDTASGAQPIGVAGVDAPDERIDEPLEHLSPEPRRRRAGRGRRAASTRRGSNGSTAARAIPPTLEDPRSRHGQDLARHAEREAGRQPAQSRPRPHVGTRVRRRHELIAEPEPLAQRDALRALARETHRPPRRPRALRTGTCGCCRPSRSRLRAPSPRRRTSTSSSAHARPVMPPPTTTTCVTCCDTSSTSRARHAGSVWGSTPWPKLKMWRGPVPARRMTSSARCSTTGHSPRQTAGSRLPCNVTSSPTRARATSSGTRQSTPSTSAPADTISSSSSPVPTPKWMRGTPRSATPSKHLAARRQHERLVVGRAQVAHPAVEQLHCSRARLHLRAQRRDREIGQAVEQPVATTRGRRTSAPSCARRSARAVPR